MLPSLLEIPPSISGVPTNELRNADIRLRQVATRVAQQEEEENKVRRRLISSVLPDARPRAFTVADFKEAVMARIAAIYGRNFGPIQNARNDLNDFALRAQAAGYPLASREVQDAFVNFLLMYETKGLMGEDTTGTQMGRFQGTWRGGGFS